MCLIFGSAEYQGLVASQYTIPKGRFYKRQIPPKRVQEFDFGEMRTIVLMCKPRQGIGWHGYYPGAYGIGKETISLSEVSIGANICRRCRGLTVRPDCAIFVATCGFDTAGVLTRENMTRSEEVEYGRKGALAYIEEMRFREPLVLTLHWVNQDDPAAP